MKLISLWGKLENLPLWNDFIFLNKRKRGDYLLYTYGLYNLHSWNDVVTFEIEGAEDIPTKDVKKFLDIEVTPFRI